MEILKDKTCPECNHPDSLFVCAIAGAVNCSNCHEFIRLLTKEEKEILIKNVSGLMKKTKELKIKI